MRKEFKIKAGDFCPACKAGIMKLKSGPYSMFLACDKYPYCAFTQALPKPKKSKLEQKADRLLNKYP